MPMWDNGVLPDFDRVPENTVRLYHARTGRLFSTYRLDQPWVTNFLDAMQKTGQYIVW